MQPEKSSPGFMPGLVVRVLRRALDFLAVLSLPDQVILPFPAALL
jgi:hypothetical protein